MLRSFALLGLVLAGCAPAAPGAQVAAPVAYAAPVYANPMPYSHIDPAPFMNQNSAPQPVNTTCYPIGMYVNCRSY
jgi:hypothetical protein